MFFLLFRKKLILWRLIINEILRERGKFMMNDVMIGFKEHKRITYLLIALELRVFYRFTLIREYSLNLCHRCSIWK